MKKVITFGAFDLVHEWHKFFLGEAKKYWDFLITIVARDKTIQKVKWKAPLNKEQKRLKDIQSLWIADIVELGHQTDMMFAIKNTNQTSLQSDTIKTALFMSWVNF